MRYLVEMATLLNWLICASLIALWTLASPNPSQAALASPVDMQNCLEVKADYPELWKGQNDKFAHCALACQIAKRFGPWIANNCALAKEVWDKYDGDPGTQSDPLDYKASLVGIRVSRTGEDCAPGCHSKGY